MQQTKQTLSASRRRLIEAMQKLNYGQILDLTIRGGDPVFDPPPRVLRDIKIGGENGPRLEIAKRDFVLRREVIELLTHLDRLGDGLVCRIDVQRGLPFKVTIQEVIA